MLHLVPEVPCGAPGRLVTLQREPVPVKLPSELLIIHAGSKAVALKLPLLCASATDATAMVKLRIFTLKVAPFRFHYICLDRPLGLMRDERSPRNGTTGITKPPILRFDR